MQRQVDLVGVLDAFLHGFGLPPRLVVLLVVQVSQIVTGELVLLAAVARSAYQSRLCKYILGTYYNLSKDRLL